MGKFIMGIAIGLGIALLVEASPTMFGTLASAQTGRRPELPPAKITNSTRCSRAQEAANKRFVTSLSPDAATLAAAMHADYIQHSPEFVRFGKLNGTKGRESFELMTQVDAALGTGPKSLAPVPGRPAIDPFHLIMAECDLVMLLRQEWTPDPDTPGTFYPNYAFEVFRVRDGKLYEHWDGATIPTPVPEYLRVPAKDILKSKR